METNSRILVVGNQGLVGSAIMRKLDAAGFRNVIGVNRAVLDLRNQSAVSELFGNGRPEYVFLAAAKVGGIHANTTYPADFIRDNLQIQTNVIDAAWRSGTRRLLFLGSSCVYPKHASQPIREEYLLTGALEPTNEPYAIAKIAGLKMCEAYRRQYGFDALSLMPTNLYGPDDNFDLETSHVVSALIKKLHEAKVRGDSQVIIWGTGGPRREFLHVDDLANAAVYMMGLDSEKLEAVAPNRLINIGVGKDMEIAELARLLRSIIHPKSTLQFDATKADGTPRKLLDISRATALGWQPKIELETGLRSTYDWFVRSQESHPDNTQSGA